MSDIVNDLKFYANKGTYCPDKIMHSAAAEITRLRAIIEQDNVDAVKIPASIEEARAMAILATNYLQEFSPDALHPPKDSTEPVRGDYVLATKYDDGSPADHWGIGFYDGQRNERHYVFDGKGEQIRAGGFRRVGKIPDWLGYLLLKSANDLEANHAEENLWNIVNSITKDSTEPASKDADASSLVTVDKRDLFDFVRSALRDVIEESATDELTSREEMAIYHRATDLTDKCLSKLYAKPAAPTTPKGGE